MPSIHTLSALLLQCVLVVGSAGVFAEAQAATATSQQDLYRADLSSGHVVMSIWHQLQMNGAVGLESARDAAWQLIGVSESPSNGTRSLVYFDSSTNELAVDFYGGTSDKSLFGSAALTRLAAGWSASAVADIKSDGSLGVIAANRTTGEAAVYFFGGASGVAVLSREPITALSVIGWNVVGAADLNGDSHPDLILQNQSTRQVRVAYLGGSNGTTVTAVEDLESSSFSGWTAAGMQDMNGDGHADLILANDATGETIVNYYGGALGVTYLGSHYLERSGLATSKLLVPSESATTAGSEEAIAGSNADVTNKANATIPILIFNGVGTSGTDVTAVESVVTSMGLAYHTANSAQLDAMSQAQLTAYKLFIVPGGNSITIGKNLSANASSTVHNSVAAGLNYLGICAGGFFGGFSAYYNGLNLTSGTWFNFYADYNKGIHKEAVEISFPGKQPQLDIYWQDGPQLSGWGQVVGKYPNGTPAVTQGYWGKGFVVLSGVHPEAPASWRYGMVFKTPLDTDLAFASSLVKAAMNRAALPHF